MQLASGDLMAGRDLVYPPRAPINDAVGELPFTGEQDEVTNNA